MTETRSRFRATLREPLVQFLLAGIVLLLAQRACAPVSAAASSAERIEISAQAQDSMRALFRKNNGHWPSADELAREVEHQVDEEVLYREAMRLGLDREDVIVRRQLQQKMRFLLEDVEALPEATREELQAWLDGRREHYAKPATLSFEQVFLSRARHGAQLEFDAVERLRVLQARAQDHHPFSDPFPAGLEFSQLDARAIEKNFGKEFADRLSKQPPQLDGQWIGPLPSGMGLHLVRVTGRGAAQPVTVEQAGAALINDLRQHRREEANRSALRRMRARYQVVMADGPAS
jgi:hypothetical protein